MEGAGALAEQKICLAGWKKLLLKLLPIPSAVVFV